MEKVFNSASTHEAKMEPFLSTGSTKFCGKRIYSAPTFQCMVVEPTVILAGSNPIASGSGDSKNGAKSTTFEDLTTEDDLSFNTQTK